jgi:hypothetical protein
MIDKDLVDTTDKGIYNLKHDAIAEVQIKHTPSVRYIQDYHEKPSPYLIKLKGENRWRRVYNTQIGNTSVMYIKLKYYNHIYCEVAVDEAINNV